MKVLFVASGNKKYGVSSFVAAQAKSLREVGVEVVVFPVVGHGKKGYLSNLYKLHNTIKQENPDIVHAHYTVCGVLATLSCRKPVVVSVLGSFPNPKSFKIKWVRFFIKHIWTHTLTKSRRTANQLGIEGLSIVPNGVDLVQFKPYNYLDARSELGFDASKKYVIFVSDPKRPEKNYALAQKAVSMLCDDNVILLPVYDKPHDEVVKYLSAADVLILTSVSEGSPNVVKEALACNCPVVSTDVGDVRERVAGLDGCYVADGDARSCAASLADCLRKSLVYSGRTEGRERLMDDGLSSGQVAVRLKTIYDRVLSKENSQ